MYSIFKKILTYNVIALIHHPLYLEFKGQRSKKFLRLEKENFKKINKFIVTSKNTKNLLINEFKVVNNKISVVEPGIERLAKYNFKNNSKIHLLSISSSEHYYRDHRDNGFHTHHPSVPQPFHESRPPILFSP